MEQQCVPIASDLHTQHYMFLLLAFHLALTLEGTKTKNKCTKVKSFDYFIQSVKIVQTIGVQCMAPGVAVYLYGIIVSNSCCYKYNVTYLELKYPLIVDMGNFGSFCLLLATRLVFFL